MNSLRRKLVCFVFAAILLFPFIPTHPSDAQYVGTKWKVEMTTTAESVFYDLAETVTGDVEVVKDPASGALVLNGTGEGTWTYRHREKGDQCPALSGDGTFEVTFSGNVQHGISNSQPVFVMLQAAPGGDRFGSEIGKYVRSESVTCHDEEITWEEPRILAPVVIGPLGKTLDEFIGEQRRSANGNLCAARGVHFEYFGNIRLKGHFQADPALEKIDSPAILSSASLMAGWEDGRVLPT